MAEYSPDLAGAPYPAAKEPEEERYRL